MKNFSCKTHPLLAIRRGKRNTGTEPLINTFFSANISWNNVNKYFQTFPYFLKMIHVDRLTLQVVFKIMTVNEVPSKQRGFIEFKLCHGGIGANHKYSQAFTECLWILVVDKSTIIVK